MVEKKTRKTPATTKPRIKKADSEKAVKEPKKAVLAEDRYLRALGRRKRATAVAKLYRSKKEILINGKTLNDYFPILEMQKIVQEPLKVADLLGKFGVEITSRGGGVRGQAEASRLAIARAIIKENQELKKIFKLSGLLTRDAREKERKKFGLKKARRAPQWRKR